MSKIPEGATHTYTEPTGATYRKKVGDEWFAYSDGDWLLVISPASLWYASIQNEATWSGKVLPPVGIDCEALWNSIEGTYVSCKIVGRDEDRAVFRYTSGERKGEYQSDTMEGYGNPQLVNFRPTRTPEQIASEKRDAAIKEMQRLVGSCSTFPFSELYDYGYRLQVEK